MFMAEDIARDPMIDLIELHTRAKAAFNRAFVQHDDALCDAEATSFEALATAQPLSVAGAAALLRYLLTCDREWPDDFRLELLTALEAALKQQAGNTARMIDEA